jgi:hypothetical protein
MQAPQQPASQPFFIEVQPAKPEQENLGNVIVGAFGLTGALVLGAVLSGTVLAGLWIVWRKWRRTYETDAPPTLGKTPLGQRSEGKGQR